MIVGLIAFSIFLLVSLSILLYYVFRDDDKKGD